MTTLPSGAAATPSPPGEPSTSPVTTRPDSAGDRTPFLAPIAVRQFGPYELLEEIDRGGMGIVYRARQAGLDRVVALKMILMGPAAQREEVMRFQREARAAGRLRHAHIIAVHDAGTIDGQHYFTMPLARHGSLAAHVARLGSDPRAAVALVEKVARAVQHAHENGILHRDLKPANILLDDGDEPWVADFGLAKILDADESLTRTGKGLGTPAYMAPEQSGGTPSAGAGADVWSLGVILYELLAGRRPFRGPPDVVLDRVRKDRPERLCRLRRGLDPYLEAIVLKCLNKESSRRYISAGALADDLARWLRGEPVSARPEGLAIQAWPWVKRHALPLAALGVLLLALAGGAVVWVFWPFGQGATSAEARREEERRQTLADIQRKLGAGQEQTLIGQVGGPRWHDWPLEPGESLLTAPADEPFRVRAPGLGLLRLLTNPHVLHYRIEARIRHLMNRDGEVGLFFGYRPLPGGESPQHLYWVLAFEDSPDGGWLRLRRVRWARGGDVHMEGRGLDLKIEPTDAPHARSLAVEVRAAEIVVWWEGQEVARLGPDELERVRRFVSLDSPQPIADLVNPRGGLGLYIRETQAEFSDVVVRPLPDP